MKCHRAPVYYILLLMPVYFYIDWQISSSFFVHTTVLFVLFMQWRFDS